MFDQTKHTLGYSNTALIQINETYPKRTRTNP